MHCANPTVGVCLIYRRVSVSQIGFHIPILGGFGKGSKKGSRNAGRNGKPRRYRQQEARQGAPGIPKGTPEVNTCKRCGNPTPNKQWCSQQCRLRKTVTECEIPGCRQTFEAAPSRVRRGLVVHCPRHRGPKHSANPDVPTYVYVAIHQRSGAGKIGVTTHPARRLSQLGKGWDYIALELYRCRKEAMRVEADLLARCTTRGWASWSRQAPSETFNARVDNAGMLAVAARRYGSVIS